MKALSFFVAAAMLAVLNLPSRVGAQGSSAIGAAPVDPQIAAMVNAVSADDLRDIDKHLVDFGTRNLFSEKLPSKMRGVFAARDWLATQFEAIAKNSSGRMSVSLDTYTLPKTDRTPRAVLVSSVIATLKGDGDGRTYVMSSHYDSRNSDGNDAVLDSPGADDNGSGTSAVLEAARAMASHPFHSTIIFAAFDGEEQGLFGSAHFAKLLKSRGVRVAGDINNDIIGTSHGHDGEESPDTVRLFSEALPVDAKLRAIDLFGAENDSRSRELARFVKTTSEAYVPPMQAELIYRSDRFLRGGDQQSFTEVGFPAVRFVEAHENFDHQHQNVRIENGIEYGDLQKYMDFDYLARVTKMNVAALAALALGPDVPAKVQMLTRTLGYDATLRWKTVPRATAYEIVWRATDSPVWQYSKDVGNVTQATVKVSKDDFILGVRAVDAQGHRSVVVYPTPVRE
ncbi:MAG: M20/M25/M40 family metallo-hydrolase [Candidatus Eremiobacteraeota bacterium]|nr:M20/M25/M40 family metallo-hydrolase [Candidatus Eremiobacteraeota bacterium]